MSGLVIVGHGPSSKGKGWGEELDKHTVVRLKDWSWQVSGEWSKDLGTRVDYCCASTECMFLMVESSQVTRKRPKEFWAQPKRGAWNHELAAKVSRETGGRLRIPLDIHLKWNDRFLEMGGRAPNISLGLATITYALEFLKPETVFLVGFDNLLNPNLLEYHKVHKGKWVTRHDWHTENRLLDEIDAFYGVPILPWGMATRFSQPQRLDELLQRYESPSVSVTG